MTYAAWTKISAALVVAARDAPAAWVEESPDGGIGALPTRSRRSLSNRPCQCRTKGWRWKDEMHEIARTFLDVGLPGGSAPRPPQLFARGPGRNLSPAADQSLI